MSSLAATLLARSSATVQTRQALIVTGLQNDFVSPEGKLPMTTQSRFIERIKQLVPAFREHGIIIWVWTEYRGDRTVNDPSGSGCRVMIPEPKPEPAAEVDPSREQAAPPPTRSQSSRRPPGRHSAMIARAMAMVAELDSAEGDMPLLTSVSDDPELFLSETATREACCKPGTWGAKPIPEIKDLIHPKDIQVTKSYYSAFSQTSLLLQLRAKLITDLYFAGCNTNLSVYATATDVARHGLEINIVQDCLGCRQPDRHDQAVKIMVNDMGARLTTAHSVIARLRGEEEQESEESEDGSGDEEDPQSSTDSVRQSLLSHNQSKGSILSARASSIGAIEHSDVDGTPSEHAKPPSVGHTADTKLPSPVAGSEEDKHQTAAIAGEVGRQRVGTSKDLNVAQASRADPGEHRVGLDRVNVLPTRLKSVENENVSLKSTAPVAMIPSNSTDAQHSLQSPNIPPVTGNVLSVGSGPSAVAEAVGTSLGRGIRRAGQKKGWQNIAPILGPDDIIGNGDSSIVFDLLPTDLSETIFLRLLHEVHWQRMYHAAGEVPRLVCCQGDINPTDGSMPVYRHPADHTLPLLHWSPGIARVRRAAEEKVGHPLNHVLIQLYRHGQDYISEHSDKTLDIAPNSKIVNVSFGAQRTMRLRTKRGAQAAGSTSTAQSASEASTINEGSGPQRTTQRIPMPHNSMFVMGLDTNASWLHGITPDKRMDRDRTSAELAYNGMRISLTFRHINTYLSSDSRLIWGQGATSKDADSARPTINGSALDSQKLIDAFGTENQSTEFDWKSTYGRGFDVLHLKSPPENEQQPILFLSGDTHADLAVKLFLSHTDISAAEVVSTALPDPRTPFLDGDCNPVPPVPNRRTVGFRDNDVLHTVIGGEAATLLYLNRLHSRHNSPDIDTKPAALLQAARELELLTSGLLDELRDLLKQTTTTSTTAEDDEHVSVKLRSRHALRDLEDQIRNRTSGSSTAPWLAGTAFGVADCAFWSVVQAFRTTVLNNNFAAQFPALDDWAQRVQARPEVARMMAGCKPSSRDNIESNKSESEIKRDGSGGNDSKHAATTTNTTTTTMTIDKHDITAENKQVKSTPEADSEEIDDDLARLMWERGWQERDCSC